MAYNRNSVSRRQFSKAVVFSATGAIIPASVFSQDRRPAPSQRINVGIVGLSARGYHLLNALLKEHDTQIVAVCDCDRLHYRDGPWGDGPTYGREPAKNQIEDHYAKQTRNGRFHGVRAYADYRELCARDDLQAVFVATPDHWHALISLEALRAGKDVYCEKPVTHTFYEGQLVCQEVAQRNAIFQVGSQQRSGAKFQHVVKLVQDGHIGPIHRVEVGLPKGYDKPMADATVQDPPETVDYDLWTGPAPRLAYMRARHHRWWRGNRAYGGGVLMDWIGHHNDIAHWALGLEESGPVKVEAVGWTYPETSIYDAPLDYEILCEYRDGVMNSISTRHRHGTKFIGEDGWIFVNRDVLEASKPSMVKPGLLKGPKLDCTAHVRNFLDCVGSRQPCIAPAEAGHRSITPGHLGYVSNELGRALRWDAKAERVKDDEEADKLLKAVSYRKPWTLGRT